MSVRTDSVISTVIIAARSAWLSGHSWFWKLTSLLLAVAGEPVWFWRIMLGLLLVIWLSTALWQGPLHGRLQREGPRPDLLRALVRGNWLRTVLWTARSAGLVWFYARGWA